MEKNVSVPFDYRTKEEKRLSHFARDSRLDLFGIQHNPARIHLSQQFADSLAEHGVNEILTLDGDFARFPQVASRNPFLS